MLSLISATSALLIAPRAAPPRMTCVEEFSISKVVKQVQVFDGGYAAEVCDLVSEIAQASIAAKGSFSLAIPGGSVVAALSELDASAFDPTKVHIFFCNEKIPSFPCIEGGLAAAKKMGVPEDQVYGFGEGTPAEIAEKYSELLKTHPSIDNTGSVPSLDLMLLGTGPDGHVGCLFPDTPEIKATGSGAVVLAGNDERADGDFVALSMDVMCATKTVLVSAAAEARAPMVATALAGTFGPFDCPAGMVEAQEETLWFTDTESIAEFDADGLAGEEEEAEEE